MNALAGIALDPQAVSLKSFVARHPCEVTPAGSRA